MFTKIYTISVPVKDLEVSKAFYIDVLGCGVVGNLSIIAGMRWLRLEFPDVETRLVLVTWFPNMRRAACRESS